MKVKIKKGFTLLESLISILLASFILIGSTEIFLRTGKLNEKISLATEQRTYISNLKDSLANEISKAKFFYFSTNQGMPTDVLDDLKNLVSNQNAVSSDFNYMNQPSGGPPDNLTPADNNYNLASIKDFSVSNPNYSSVILGGNTNTQSDNSSPVPGEILHFAQLEIVDLIKLFKSQPSYSDNNSALNLGYGLDQEGKIFIRMITDCYVYPRNSINNNNYQEQEIVIRKSRYAFLVIPDQRNLIQKYRPDIILNTNVIEKNTDLPTSVVKELAWKSLYEKITFKLLERGYVPWAEMDSNSTFMFQNTSNIFTQNIMNHVTLVNLPTNITNHVIYSKKVLAKNISSGVLIRDGKTLSKNGIYFKIEKNIPDESKLNDYPADQLMPGQKNHFITGLEIKIDLKKPINDRSGTRYLTKSDDFTIETRNNRVYL